LSNIGISAVVLAVSCGSALLLTPVCRRVALRLDILDRSDSRKTHARATPYLGGASVYFSVVIALAVLFLWYSEFWSDKYLALPIVALIAAGLGLVDDIRGLEAPPKLVVEAAIGVILYYCGFRIDSITSPFGPSIELGGFGLLLTVVWTCVIINAINLIDGLDGLAAGVVTISCSFLLALRLKAGDVQTSVLLAVIVGSSAGFLYYNFSPAKIFLGDMGTILIGTLVAAATILGEVKQSAIAALMVPIVVLLMPITDVILSIIRRSRQNRSWFHADREHIHHRLVALGLPPRTAVMLIYAVNVYLGLFAVVLSGVTLAYSLLIVLMLLIFVLMLLVILQYIENRPAGDAEANMAGEFQERQE